MPFKTFYWLSHCGILNNYSPNWRWLVVDIYWIFTEPLRSNRGYYMAARGYEFYIRVLKVSLTSERSERVRDTFKVERIFLSSNCLLFCVLRPIQIYLHRMYCAGVCLLYTSDAADE